MAGLVMATLCLGGFWIVATVALMRQDEAIDRKSIGLQLAELRRTHPIHRRVFAEGIRAYMRRDFHPSQNDDEHLAAEYLASVGLA
jgi:uncharacterized protein